LPIEQDCVVTVPVLEIVRHCPACVERLVMAREVVVAFVKERLVPEIAVVEAKLMSEGAAPETLRIPPIVVEPLTKRLLVVAEPVI